MNRLREKNTLLKYLIIMALFLVPVFAVQCVLSQEKNSGMEIKSPKDIVVQYIENDLRGSRLSSRTWREKMHPFYYDTETDEPGWDTITVVKGYTIVTTGITGNDATVAVHYDILCDIGTQVSVRSKTDARVVYSLRMRNGAWKLNGYKTCPLVSEDTAIKHVAGLCKKSGNNTAAKKRNQKLLRDLQQLIKEKKQ